MPRPARRPPTPAPRPTGPVSCARPGCAAPIAAWLTYDYQSRRLWLDDGGSGGDCWPLCAGHADTLRAPLGWTQDDRRAGVLPP